MSSSTSSSSSAFVYDVFPSFRGTDVREKFRAHFLKELDRKHITTFLDDEIQTGESLDPVLKKAIKDSKIAVVIFSKNYASSGWCLNELLEIVKCKEQFGQMVIPVFYDLDPSDVRYQINEFGEVFKETCDHRNRSEDEKQKWRKALTDVANLKGYHSLNLLNNEAKMIEIIADDVLDKLKSTPSHDFDEGIVGIEDHIAKMKTLLELTCKEVRTVGIWGPSGIGKTTIARALYTSLSDEFQSKIYINRIFINKSMEYCSRGNSTDYNMKLHLQENFLVKLLKKPGIEVDHLGAVKGKLKNRKVLIFIDDLEDQVVLKTLAGGDEWFGPGSRIIVITKDMQMLRGHGIICTYEVGIPSKELALQILCKSAFNQISPPDGFMELASEVAMLVGSLPLGLSVLGSSLSGKDKEDWVDMLPTLRKGLHKGIEEALSMSYEKLERKDYKALFRYIACFFNGDEIDNIKLMLEDSELHIDNGIKILVDKSLIRVPSWNSTKVVEMHCLVQEMGKEVVRAQSDKPGEREFLMDSKDVCNLLKSSTGTEKVIGISLDLDETNKVKIHENAFEGMHNLRFLKFYKTSLERKKEVKWVVPEKIKYFPDELKLLSWPGYPMKSLPSGFCPEYLIEFRMPQSKLKKLWKGVKTLTCLKVIDLSESQNLEEISDLSEATNLETVNLSGCSSLMQLPSSVKYLNKLTVLNMAGCTKLEALPNDTNLQSLTRLNVSECSKLKDFPNISSKIQSLIANNTAFQRFPSILRLENLVELHMENFTSERLWEGIQPLTNLTTMVLSGSENLKEVPDLSMATRLKTLKLNDCSSIVELALSSIQNLDKLTTLEMIGCSSLVTLPTGINLKSLSRLNLNGCTHLKSFPNISTYISFLSLSQTAIEEVPRRIEYFTSLEYMEMKDCKVLETLPTGINVKSLHRLNLSGCSRLRSFPDISSNIASLSLNQTAIEEVPPWIHKFSSLENLDMWESKELKRISPRVFKLENLDELFFSHCEHLTEVSWPDCPEVEAEVTNNTRTNLSLISFTNCLNLNQETLIQQSASRYLILPGVEVPDYFTHRSTGNTFTISLPHSSIFQQSSLDFKACVVVSDLSSECSETNNDQLFFINIEVHCRFKDSHGNYFGPAKSKDFSLPQKYDHLTIFNCQFSQIKNDGESSCEQIEIQLNLVSTRLRLTRCGILMLMNGPSLS